MTPREIQGVLEAYPSFIFREAAVWKGKPTKGRRTFVVIIRDGFAHFGVSQCCKKDQFIRRRGVEIALGRAIAKEEVNPDPSWEHNSWYRPLEQIGLHAADKRSVLARGILNQLNYLGFRQKAHV